MPEIRNLRRGIQNPRMSWILLYGAIFSPFPHFKMNNGEDVFVVAQGLLCTRLLAVSLFLQN